MPFLLLLLYSLNVITIWIFILRLPFFTTYDASILLQLSICDFRCLYTSETEHMQWWIFWTELTSQLSSLSYTTLYYYYCPTTNGVGWLLLSTIACSLLIYYSILLLLLTTLLLLLLTTLLYSMLLLLALYYSLLYTTYYLLLYTTYYYYLHYYNLLLVLYSYYLLLYAPILLCTTTLAGLLYGICNDGMFNLLKICWGSGILLATTLYSMHLHYTYSLLY